MSSSRRNVSPSRPPKDIGEKFVATAALGRVTSRSRLATEVRTVESMKEEETEQTRQQATRSNYQLICEKNASDAPYVSSVSIYDNDKQQQQPTYTFRVVLAGSSGVGKTSIIQRIFQTTAMDSPSPSQCFAEWHLLVRMSDGAVIHVTLCDTAGEERYECLMPIHYRGAHGCLVIYDITSIESYNQVMQYIQQAQRYATNPYIMLIGNKKDLESSRVVPSNDAIQFANVNKFFLCETSAQTGVGIDVAFHRFIAALYNKQARSPLSPRQYQHSLTMSGTIVIKTSSTENANVKEQGKCSSC